MDLIEEALWWAEQGIPVFPTGEDKRPLTRNGHKDASTDPAVVAAMFEEVGTRLHGIGARMGRDAGLFAIDADLYKPGEAGASAAQFVERLQRTKLLPETRTHRTRNGGVHYILRSNTDWPNVNPVSGVEVKGEGGYIILPPSPGYTVEREGVADAPSGLIAELKAARSAQSGRSIDTLKSAILKGEDFHDSLTQIAAKLAAEGKPLEAVQAELLDTLAASVAMVPTHPRHDRWRPLVENRQGELTRIVESANRKFNPTIASDALREAAGAMFADIAPLPWSEEPKLPAVRSVADYRAAGGFPFADWRGYFATEDLKVLEQKFVMYPILSENEVTLISADPKAGKTLISQTIAMHIASGRDLAGLKVAEQRPVFYFALESQVAIRKRLEAWCQFHDPNQTGLKAALQMYVGEGGVNMMDETARIDLANRLAATEAWFREEHATQPLGAIVIDTLTKAMPGGDQNSVEDTSAVFDIIAKIREVGLKAPVIIIHHNTKGSSAPRGSGNIQAEPDTLLTVSKREDTGQLELRVLMARSIDDTQSYLFNIETEFLGVTEQGYEITAPVLIPATEILDDGASAYIGQTLRYLPIYEYLVQNTSLGSYIHNKQLHKLLKNCPAAADAYAPYMTVRADSTKLNALWLDLFPADGRNVELSSGTYNFVATVHQNKDKYALVSGIVIRKFAD
jgi:hypothetical protein